jgi:Domain of unknown function (DUF4279)
MLHLSRSVAALRISGESLVPEEVSALLGGIPALARAKGQEIDIGLGRIRIAKFGQWHFEATSIEPGNLDAQIVEILEQLSDKLSVWSALAQRFDIDLYCGWFMKERNEGIELSPSTLQCLGERGIKLSLEIYDPISEPLTADTSPLRAHDASTWMSKA